MRGKLCFCVGSVLALALILFSPLIVFATGILNGTVNELCANLPVANAAVALSNGPLPVVPTTTAADGTYSFLNLAAGTYDLKVSKSGYIDGTVQVLIIDQQTITQNFVLLRSGVGSDLLGTVKIAGTSTPIGGALVTVESTLIPPLATLSDGSYDFVYCFLPGTYSVTASKPGFLSQTIPGVVVVDGQPTRQDFNLVSGQSVPALSYLGMIIFAILIAASTSWVIRRRQRA